IRAVVNAREIAAEKRALEALQQTIGSARPDKAQAEELVARRKRIALLERRLAIVKARLGEDFLGEPAP
ncbi:MAG: hypothetical protein ACK4N5_16890, partial [Myxococcales bacterium]